MNHRLKIVFDRFKEILRIELDDSKSPMVVQKILANLPIKSTINVWGEEIYTNNIGIDVTTSKDYSQEVNIFDVAYWPDGNAICIFFGPTPISKDNKILPYSSVNIIGRVLVDLDQDYNKLLKKIQNGMDIIISRTKNT